MLKLGELLKSNIWINANAGSGKTTVLIKRFLVFLLNNYSHNEILCITYTKVAANEMKTRINRLIPYSDLLILPSKEKGFLNMIFFLKLLILLNI